MNDKILLERIKRYDKLSIKDKLIYQKASRFRHNRLLEILYFSAVLFCFKLAFETFRTSVNYGIKFKPFDIFTSSIIIFIINFILQFGTYVLFLFTGVLCLIFYLKFISKTNKKDLEVLNKIRYG